jgi:hypothetical protein
MKKKVKVVRPFGGVCAADHVRGLAVPVVVCAHRSFREQVPYRDHAPPFAFETGSAREGFRL